MVEAALAESEGQVSGHLRGGETKHASAHARLENQAFENQQVSVQSPTRHLNRSTAFSKISVSLSNSRNQNQLLWRSSSPFNFQVADNSEVMAPSASSD